MTSGICVFLKHIKFFTITICSSQYTWQEYAIMYPSKGLLPNPETHQNETCVLLPSSSLCTQYLRDTFRNMSHELPSLFWILLVYASLFTLLLHVGKNCLSMRHSTFGIGGAECIWNLNVLVCKCLPASLSWGWNCSAGEELGPTCIVMRGLKPKP